MAPRSPDRPAPDLRVVRVGFGHPDAMRLIAAVQAEYVARYGGEDETPLDHAMFEPPRGSFFVGYLLDRAAVSGAWRRRDDVTALGSTATAEIKRMYVAPDARGRGLGEALLLLALHGFRRAGVRRAFLEVTANNHAAVRLYRRLGFRSYITVYREIVRPAPAAT